MKFANASKVYRKSGVRWGEHGAPVLFPLNLVGVQTVTQSYCLSFQQWTKSVRLWLTPITLKARVCLE
jgi:hypothetical protein